MTEINANKVPGSLSLALDGTLKSGHDMKVFGLGTLATMASVERYSRFTTSMHAVYETLERRLDGLPDGPAKDVWAEYGDVLRRESLIRKDLASVGVAAPRTWEEKEDLDLLSPATIAYVSRVLEAGTEDVDGGGRLLGHLYCRYFADLFGGERACNVRVHEAATYEKAEF